MSGGCEIQVIQITIQITDLLAQTPGANKDSKNIHSLIKLKLNSC